MAIATPIYVVRNALTMDIVTLHVDVNLTSVPLTSLTREAGERAIARLHLKDCEVVEYHPAALCLRTGSLPSDTTEIEYILVKADDPDELATFTHQDDMETPLVASTIKDLIGQIEEWTDYCNIRDELRDDGTVVMPDYYNNSTETWKIVRRTVTRQQALSPADLESIYGYLSSGTN